MLGGLPTTQEGPDFSDTASDNSNDLLQVKVNLHELQSQVQIVPLACNNMINSQLELQKGQHFHADNTPLAGKESIF